MKNLYLFVLTAFFCTALLFIHYDPFKTTDSINTIELASYGISDIFSEKKSDAVLFLGSSSIRRWRNLDKAMAPIPIIQRGFNSAKLSDINQHLDTMALNYHPKAIVLFAGINDLIAQSASTPKEVVSDFIAFSQSVLETLPDTCIFYIAITPAPKAKNLSTIIDITNQAIQSYTLTTENIVFIETSSLFVNKERRIDHSLFHTDQLHLSEKGYQAWEKVIKQALLSSRCLNHAAE